LLDTAYQGASASYQWKCTNAGHTIRRSKGNVQQSLKKGLPACGICGAARSTRVLAQKKRANEFAARVLPIIEKLQEEGCRSLGALARKLNENRIPTAAGRKWYASTVKNLLNKLSSID
jgi:Recombinase